MDASLKNAAGLNLMLQSVGSTLTATLSLPRFHEFSKVRFTFNLFYRKLMTYWAIISRLLDCFNKALYLLFPRYNKTLRNT